MGIYVKFYHDHFNILQYRCMWSCHVTLATHFENFYFSPISIFNFRKSYQIWEKLAQEQKSYRQQNKTRGGKHPYSANIHGVHVGLN